MGLFDCGREEEGSWRRRGKEEEGWRTLGTAVHSHLRNGVSKRVFRRDWEGIHTCILADKGIMRLAEKVGVTHWVPG